MIFLVLIITSPLQQDIFLVLILPLQQDIRGISYKNFNNNMYVKDGLQTREFMKSKRTRVKIIVCYLLFYIDCQNNCIKQFF